MGSRRAALAPFRHAWPHLWRHRRGLLVGAACLLPSVALDLLIPWIWKQGLDGAIERTATTRRLLAIGAGGVLLGLLSGLLKYAMRRALVGASRDFERDLRLALHRKLIDLPARWFAGTTVGDLTSRLSQDVEAVRMALGPGSMYVLSAVVTVVASFAAMVAVDPWLTLWMATPLLLLGGAALWIAPRLGKASDAVQEAIGAISSASSESFAGVRVLKAFCGEERQLSRMEQLSRRYFDAQLALARARGGMMALLFLVKDASLFVILLVGGLSIGAGHATVGDLILFRDWLLSCFWPLVTFGWIVSMVQRAAAGMRRIGGVLEAEPLALPAAPRALPATGPLALEWSHVTVEQQGRRLLDDVSLAVPAGGSLGITGRTGAGKSLLLQLVPRLFDPDGGAVRVGAIDVRELDLDALRRRIANVPQEAFLFAETLRDNLAFGNPAAADGALDAAIRHAGLESEVARFPDGLATRLGERGVTLSGGQRQRATLARALLYGGALLLIDDGFSAVDAETEARILASLRAASAGATTVVVSHRVAALQALDRVAVIEEGRLVEHGPPAELLAHGGAWARLVRDQQLIEELEAL
ncbi:MAG: ABC transporter ATP-binding protein [Planctomycetes bacterium]|nr:ABC transporter ATP-binding protein [Planctomycetota bacterium]